jgi:hypothetical protein
MDEMGMDLRSGKKLYNWLLQARLEDIQTTHIIVDTNNAKRDAFATVIESWREFSVFDIGESLNLSKMDQTSLLSGYDAQLQTIRSPYGYATWGLVACSGQKPVA